MVPFFGICLGMQMAVVEFARHVCGMTGAHSSEFSSDTKYPVIDLMPEQRDIDEMGGTMRLGIYPCKLKDGSKANAIYNDELIYERHRHRYEFNNEFRELIASKGLRLSGLSPSERLVEIIELPGHPWFIGVQFHPEFKSRPNRPHPLFKDFIRASLEKQKSK
jgi:CTP synthase